MLEQQDIEEGLLHIIHAPSDTASKLKAVRERLSLEVHLRR